MPQVPYQPVPSQVLADIPTPEMNPRIPSAAFGGEVGQALSGLGKTVEGAGTEIFNRAIALQNLNNENEANEADAKYIIQAGNLHATYNALQGKDKVTAWPKYQQDLDDTRKQIRDGLSTTMSQKLYDRTSLSTMARSIFNGAGVMAEADKQYTINTAKAGLELDAKSVEDSPKDNSLYREKVARTEQRVATLTAAQGLPENSEQAQLLRKKALSGVSMRRIIGLSREDPWGAKTALEEANKNKELTEDDALRTDQIVTSAGRAVGSANIANEVYANGKGDDTNAPKPLSVMEAEARAKAKTLAPNDPILEQHAVAALNGIYNEKKYATRQETIENQQTVAGGIASGVRTEQELRADPKIATAIDALPKSDRLNIPARINSYNAAKNKVANEDRFNQLMGMSNNDVEGFLNTDIYSDKFLNQSQMNQMTRRQEQLKKNQNQDPRVDRAMGWMRSSMGSQMEALGVFKRTTNNKNDYDHLTGTMQSALDIWQENHGKPPNYKEFTDQIAPLVIQQRSEPWMFGMFSSKKPFYNQDTPDKFKQEVTADVTAQGGVEPTPEQLNRAYIRTQLLKLYPSSKKTQ